MSHLTLNGAAAGGAGEGEARDGQGRVGPRLSCGVGPSYVVSLSDLSVLKRGKCGKNVASFGNRTKNPNSSGGMPFLDVTAIVVQDN